MLRLLHTADLHLGARFAALGEVEEERRRDFLATLSRLVGLAVEREVDLFLVSGDLFDLPRPDKTIVSCVEGQVDRLVQAGITPVLVPGTHDWQSGSDGIYGGRHFAGALVLNRPGAVKTRVRDRDIWLYSHPPQVEPGPELTEIMRRRSEDGLHVGLLHGSLRGSPEWEYRGRDLPFTLGDLAEWDLDYVALGHYHRWQKLEVGERLFACYPGSPEGKRFGEDGPRYALLVEVDTRQARAEAVEVQQRMIRQESLVLSAGMDDAAVASAVCEQAGGRDLVRLTLEGTLDRVLDIEALWQRCRPAFFYLDLVDRTRWHDLDHLDRLAREETVRGEVVRRFMRLREQAESEEAREEIDQALREILVRFQCREAS
ncbi:MAG: DNA repair exonuclease [Deltaproteobacteria bacterium]|nr:MAG: DNA repair exonuclease [Deltaproteobacteria bacterium]